MTLPFKTSVYVSINDNMDCSGSCHDDPDSFKSHSGDSTPKSSAA